MRFLIGTLFLFSCFAATAADGEYHTQARFISDHKVIAKGETFLLGVHLTMENHWHTYWENPGFSGLPTTLNLAPVEGLKVEPLQFPFPNRYEDEYGFVTFGYDSEVLLIATAVYEGSASEIELTADINWLECKELCINGQKKVSLKLAVGVSEPDNGDLFNQYRAKVPVNFGDNSPFTFDAAIDFKADAWTGTLNIKPVTADWSTKIEDFSFFPLKPASDIAELKKSELSIKDDTYSFSLNWEAFEAVSEDQLVAGVLKYTHSTGTGYSRINLWPASAVTGKAVPTKTAQLIEKKDTLEATSKGFDKGFWYFALMALIGGMILNLMPCVLPVLSLKVFALISDAGESAFARIRNAWVYTLGIMVSFLAMSLFFALSKVFGEQVGIGFQLSNPSFVVFMSVLLFVMALSFFGVFEFGAPNSNKLANLSQKSGPQGAFFMGVLMTLLSTPCTAPFLGAAYGWALSQKIVVILLIFQIIALGLALPYVVLCYMPALLKFLPKPGPWMQHMKVGMGFLMLATMVWLMSVLAGLTGPDAIIGLLTLLIPIGLGAYFIGITWYTSSRLMGVVFTLLLVAGGYYLGMRDLFQLSNPYASRDQRKEALRLELMANGGINSGDLFSELEKKITTADQIAWVPYSSETLEYFRNKNRLVFLDFTAEWCLTCKTNERLVINTAATRKLFAENKVVVMRGDYTEQKEEHTRFINSFQRAGVPLYVVYPGNGEPILLPETITRGIVADSVTEAAMQLRQAANLKPGVLEPMGWMRRKSGLLGLALVLLLVPAGLLAWPFFAGTHGAEAIEKDRDAPAFRPEPVLWQAFLDLVLDDQGGVRYQMAQTGEARALLDRYLDQVARATPATFLDDEDRLAFYINAYNALTISGVLRHWPIQSVDEVGSFHYFFRERAYKVAGQKVSLHGFETRVIRKYDPRLHFALNCASASCPRLNARAWFAEGLDTQLEKAARNFLVNSTDYDAVEHRYSLSRILRWYQDDFGGEQGVKALLKRHLGSFDPGARFDYQDYDWGLNWSKEEKPDR